MQDQSGWHIGDKVRITSGSHKGHRGILQGEGNGLLEIAVGDNLLIRCAPAGITNFSLAARRAWASMPKQAGRPKSTILRKRMVSMRLDEDLWKRLGEAVESGLIQNKESAVNLWIRQHLDSLEAQNLQEKTRTD